MLFCMMALQMWVVALSNTTIVGTAGVMAVEDFTQQREQVGPT